MAEDYERCGRTGRQSGEPCGLPAGWGTDHTGEGACKFHGGASSGAPKNNGNAETHGLRSDPGPYYARQDADEQDRIDDWAESWARRAGYDGLGFDKLFQTHAVKLHQVEAGDAHIEAEGAIAERVVARTESGAPISQGDENPAFGYQSRILKDLMRFLKEFGCLDDPDSQQAEATEGLISILNETTDVN